MKTSLNTSKNSTPQTSAPKFEIKRLWNFFGDVKEELHKVSWTTKSELALNTRVVLVATFLVGLMIYLMDLAMVQVLGFISTTVKFILGIR